jgi:hypothetical protein
MDIRNSNINLKFDKENPFKVPEGYFESLSGRIMGNVSRSGMVPQSKRIVRMQVVKRVALYVMAACVVGLVAVFVMPHHDVAANSEVASSATSTSRTDADNDALVYDEDFQLDVLDYAMLDYDDVYTYLAGINID